MCSSAIVMPGLRKARQAQSLQLSRLDVSNNPCSLNSSAFIKSQINEDEVYETKALNIADLNKIFEVPPYSQSVTLGKQVELRCHPPKGKPKPRVRNPLAG